MLRTKKLSTITAVFWFLLLYIVAALVWWYISLHQQNERMSGMLIGELKQDDVGYVATVEKIEDSRKRKNTQYLSEGLTFLIVTLIGAGFVFRAARRRLRLSQQQQNFMMTVTHELKTPLSVAQLNLETLLRRNLSEEQQRKLVSATMQEVSRLNTLSNNILLASRMDAGEYKSIKSNINLSEQVRKVYNEFVIRYPERPFTMELTDEIFLHGEALLIELLFSNIIENACKYSPRYSPVVVSLKNGIKSVVFSVADEGVGIPDDEKLRIFEKFYRVGHEAVRTTKGTGLGLYLCKQIANDHHAEVVVYNRKPQGSIFSVTFKT